MELMLQTHFEVPIYPILCRISSEYASQTAEEISHCSAMANLLQGVSGNTYIQHKPNGRSMLHFNIKENINMLAGIKQGI